jgi:hypothetical protein
MAAPEIAVANREQRRWLPAERRQLEHVISGLLERREAAEASSNWGEPTR